MTETPVSGIGQWRERLRRTSARARRATPFALGVLAAFAALLLYRVLLPGPPPLTSGDVNTTVADALASITPAPAYSAQVYQIIRPSLVYIQTDALSSTGRPANGLGSGVVVNQEGDILTSLHVVADASDIIVTFADGTQSSAEVVAVQEESDIAVLRTRELPGLLVPATLGNPNALQVGDEAYVVGHPLGLYGSMSAGIISGFDRSFQPPDGAQPLEGLIQIDAAVNPGNSGGPLLNRSGQVVGIVTGLVNPTEQEVFIGIGFAVPITVAGGAAGLPPY